MAKFNEEFCTVLENKIYYILGNDKFKDVTLQIVFTSVFLVIKL